MVLSPPAQLNVSPFTIVFNSDVAAASVVEPPPIATALSRFTVAPEPIATPLTTLALAAVPNANEISPASAFTPTATAASPAEVSVYCPPSHFKLLPVNLLYAVPIVSVVRFPSKSV